jgi:hypothetical protein
MGEVKFKAGQAPSSLCVAATTQILTLILLHQPPPSKPPLPPSTSRHLSQSPRRYLQVNISNAVLSSYPTCSTTKSGHHVQLQPTVDVKSRRRLEVNKTTFLTTPLTSSTTIPLKTLHIWYSRNSKMLRRGGLKIWQENLDVLLPLFLRMLAAVNARRIDAMNLLE